MRLGMGEILVILALALLFFGPSKLPQLGASLGQAIKGFKKGLSEIGGSEEETKPPEEARLPEATKAPAAKSSSASEIPRA
jgi:sec-independent protein translocase protein TatA